MSKTAAVVANYNDTPKAQDPNLDPTRFPWHEVVKVQHYWLAVDAMASAVRVKEEEGRYGQGDDPQQ
ncbi:MAG: hypothetical protein AB1625_10445 [Acidobacteriota bacterium]